MYLTNRKKTRNFLAEVYRIWCSCDFGWLVFGLIPDRASLGYGHDAGAILAAFWALLDFALILV